MQKRKALASVDGAVLKQISENEKIYQYPHGKNKFIQSLLSEKVKKEESDRLVLKSIAEYKSRAPARVRMFTIIPIKCSIYMF